MNFGWITQCFPIIISPQYVFKWINQIGVHRQNCAKPHTKFKTEIYFFNFQKFLTVSATGSEYIGSASSPLVSLVFPPVGTGTPTGSSPAGTPAAGST